MGDVVKFLAADFFKLLAALLQFFVNLDSFFGHPFVRLLRAADERKVITGCDAFMSVGIQTDTEDHGFAFFLLRYV